MSLVNMFSSVSPTTREPDMMVVPIIRPSTTIMVLTFLRETFLMPILKSIFIL